MSHLPPDLLETWTEMETLAICPLCGSSRHAPAYPEDVRRCHTCGVLFRSPRPTQAAIKASYDRGINYERWQQEAAERDAMWETRMALLERFAPGPRVLDIGTGDGRFLVTASAHGHVVDATELSDTGIVYAASRGFAVRKGQVTEIDFGGDRYDTVTLWHVLEHVPNPGEVLAVRRRLLRPGGLLVVAVPNEARALCRRIARRLRLRRAEANPFGRIPFGGEVHLTHFQPGTLKRSVSRGGFELLEFGVDDALVRRDRRALRQLRLHRWVSRLTGWHAGTAMYVVARLVDEGACKRSGLVRSRGAQVVLPGA